MKMKITFKNKKGKKKKYCFKLNNQSTVYVAKTFLTMERCKQDLKGKLVDVDFDGVIMGELSSIKVNLDEGKKQKVSLEKALNLLDAISTNMSKHPIKSDSGVYHISSRKK